MTTVTLSLISHTNVGKTTLARTLLRREIGEVRDQPHVTVVSEAHTLIATEDARLRLWDTPGFGDTVRLLNRLRRESDPIGWFLHQVWDRMANRPLWCSQEAVRNIREEADVVLYLVNAAEDPKSAGYLPHEIELLAWMKRPVLVLLNQVGPDDASATLKRWRSFLEKYPVVRDALSLDAFCRAWVEESLVLERVVDLLEGEKRSAMAGLVRAWNERNLGLFEQSSAVMAAYLAEVATDEEPIGAGAESGRSWIRGVMQDLAAVSGVERKRAMAALFDRLQAATGRLMDRLIRLHEISGSSTVQIERRIEDLSVLVNEALTPKTGAIAGAALSGLVAGLGADFLAGGFTLGGGAVLGAIAGAIGGYALGGAYRLAAGRDPAVQWQPAALDRLARETILRYLLVAHHGRGRGDYTDLDYPVHWVEDVAAQVTQRAEAFHEVWKLAAREGRSGSAVVAARLQPLLRETVLDLLRRRFPNATLLRDGDDRGGDDRGGGDRGGGDRGGGERR